MSWRFFFPLVYFCLINAEENKVRKNTPTGNDKQKIRAIIAQKVQSFFLRWWQFEMQRKKKRERKKTKERREREEKRSPENLTPGPQF